MRKIFFFYPKGRMLTGQEFASKLIAENLSDSYSFKSSCFPAFDRSAGFLSKAIYPIKTIASWFRIFLVVFSVKPKVYVNLGQTYLSLIRDGIPFRLLSILKPSLSMVISLHGHVFTTWEGHEKTCRLFISILKRAKFVTVLGEVQKEKLISLGIDNASIRIVPNTCELEDENCEKEKGSLNILYLSNLIEDKGYIEFLEAIEILSKRQCDEKIEVTLCGSIYDGDVEAKTDEIDLILNRVNSSEQISMEWVKGAYGLDKSQLFKKADIFIFPSKYKVEAQPIILIEAMSSSCAIITTEVGEIPSTISTDNAILLKKPVPEDIVEKALTLIENRELLLSMQKASKERFEKHFSIDVYKKNWREIFESL